MKKPGSLKFANIILDKIKNPIIITDAEVNIVWVNEAFELMSGYMLAEIQGQKPEFMYGPETSSLALETITHALTEREFFQIEFINYKKTGQPYWIHLEGSPLFEESQHIGFIAVGSDVTEKKAREEKLMAKNNFLLDILQDMSHEMRGPVASILGLNAAIKLAQSANEKEEMFDLLNQCALELDKIFLQLNIKIYKESQK